MSSKEFNPLLDRSILSLDSNTYYSLDRNPKVLDLKTVDTTLQAFRGGFTDGRFSYLSPKLSKIVRIDAMDFSSTGVSTLDLSSVDTSLEGYSGAFTDGKFGYFAPIGTSDGFGNNGKLVRINTETFDTNDVAFFDLTTIDTDLVGFHGCFNTSTHGYLVPHKTGGTPMGKIVRFGLGPPDFTDSTNYEVLDLESEVAAGNITGAATSSSLKFRGFRTGATDGKFAYFFPNFDDSPRWGSIIVRVDVNDFSASGVSFIDLTQIDSRIKGYSGGYFQGRHVYLPPYVNDDTTYNPYLKVALDNFTKEGVKVLNTNTPEVVNQLTGVSGDNLRRYRGGFFHGNFGYSLPRSNETFLRINLKDFKTVEALKLTDIDADLEGFGAGFVDSFFAYLIPGDDGNHGKVVRFNLF